MKSIGWQTHNINTDAIRFVGYKTRAFQRRSLGFFSFGFIDLQQQIY